MRLALLLLSLAGGGHVPAGMAPIPAGTYRPLYAPTGAPRVAVSAFALDRQAVTSGDFLRFVVANPGWRRTSVQRVFAERDYLADWAGDVDAGKDASLHEPVTNVSWFAAKAYCASQGKRLPTTAEWEYAAAASETRRDASADPSFIRRLIGLYTIHSPHSGFRNVYGVSGLHGVVWEWTLDFNDVVATDDSRSSGSGVDSRDHDVFCASAAIGAADATNYPAFLRSAVRAGLTGRSTLGSLGFRCAAGGAA